MISPGMVLFATSDCDEGRAEARQYIARFQFTTDDVRLVSRADQVLVIAKDGAVERMNNA